ncbi:amidase [Gordonia hankookensis]|uniref:amidase n=1 Tax=Gordonia hankookensis TaxID=589403 RepID=A0ABR7WFH0_9ACTN|nr:amidase [Gordonia hankookensis]MBD1320627.1 amidase [Gordonia hankookensis]
MTTETAVDQSLSRYDDYAWTNAFVHVDADEVRTEATVARPGPLHGDLFSVKDLFAVAGVPSRGGSLVLDDFRPDVDATAVTRARRAGAVFFGKTNCAEFGFGIDTETRLGGRVLHPTRDDLSPGGSSGGDAVAVATGIVDFAIAGDYGGSIRWPAQALGIFGLRPGVGNVPTYGRIGGLGADRSAPIGLARAPWRLASELEVVGVMARSAGKIADVIGVLADQQGRGEPTGRVLVTDGSEIAPISDDVRAALSSVVERARESGLVVDPAGGLFAGALEAYTELRARLDDHPDVRELSRGREELLCDSTRAVLETAPREVFVGSEVRDAWTTAMRVRRRIDGRLRGYDAVIMPCAPTGAVGFAEEVQVGGGSLTGHQLMAHLRAVSLTGLAALSVPVGHGDDGRPISVQLVGVPGTESRLCSLAEGLASSNDTQLVGAGMDERRRR